MTTPSPVSGCTLHPDPEKIVVPRKHGQVLIEPALGAIETVLRAGCTLADGVMFGGRALTELRAAAREEFLKAAREWARAVGGSVPADALSKPWVLTGHQVEFYHAGVWAKVVAADEAARRSGGVAFDLLVDHDVVDDRGFDVPTRDGDAWKRSPVHWAVASHVPADSLAAPTLEQFEQWDSELAKHPQAHSDTMAFLLTALRPREGTPRDHVAWLSRARLRLEQALGLQVHHVPTGAICESETWRTFVRAWIENAGPWSEAYNRQLAAYRKRQKIKNPHHPMPDLSRTVADGATTFELPFWIYRAGHPRQRLMVRIAAVGGATFLHDGEEQPFGPGFSIQSSEFRVRPRALTLTMYARLFLADLFIHGIGGALYDQITDGLIEELFHTAPPYACVSAAWLLPLGQPFESNEDLAVLKSDRHHAQHNPQLVIDPFTALKTDVAERICERRELVARIAESLASARRDKDAMLQRRAWFDRLHAVNGELHARVPNVLRKLDQQIAECRRAKEQNKVLLWREYFLGLHSMESLKALINAVRTEP